MISEDELDALALHILKLEARVAELTQANVDLESQTAFLMKERAFYNEGPASFGMAATVALTEIPEGYGIGNNGQLIAVNTAQAQAEIHRQWPVDRAAFKPSKRPKRPDGDA